MLSSFVTLPFQTAHGHALRIVLMIVLFVLSIALVVAGWKMTGQLAGLGIMLLGVALLLAVLAIYNATYQD